ncbi:MAG: hypothetical protein HY904_15850 [Deltaproteobacteria bacterium]|nr:hypothetical protein [Deltaproteobacteria bacterium]
MNRLASAVWVLLAVMACGTGTSGDDDDSGGALDAGGSTPDAGSAADAGTEPDAGGAAFWTGTYDPSGSPSPTSGRHNAGRDCMACHDSLGASTWLIGGTVYATSAGTAAPHVQVGLRDGTQFFSTYSATNGNFWIPKGSASVNWATVEIRLRNANGEKVMGSEATSGCNDCHTGTSRLVAP